MSNPVTKTPEQILMGGGDGIPDAFKRVQKGVPIAVGTTVGGYVKSWEAKQSTNIDTNALEFWDDGNPKMEIVLTIQTELREARYENDEGLRKLYIPESSNKQRALKGALEDQGLAFVERNGFVTMRYDGPDPASQKKFPPNLWSAWYRPAAVDIIGAAPAATSSTPPVSAPPTVVSSPEPTPVTQAAPPVTVQAAQDAAIAAAQANLANAGMTAPAPTPEPAAATTAPAGIDPAVAAAIANLTPEQRKSMGLPG